MSKHDFELGDSESELAQLVDQAARGEEIVITRDGEPVAQIVPLQRKKPREFGSGKGTFIMSPDFDEPLDDFNSKTTSRREDASSAGYAQLHLVRRGG